MADFPSDLAPALRTVRTTPLFVMRLAVKPIISVGETPASGRRVGIITGGTFEGTRISGTVLDGGSDWQSVHRDGSIALDVRVLMRTHDDATILMSYRGIRHGPADVMVRIERGEAVDPQAYYFRIAPHFETASAKYGWLNRIVAVGIGQRRGDGPVYSVFEVL